MRKCGESGWNEEWGNVEGDGWTSGHGKMIVSLGDLKSYLV